MSNAKNQQAQLTKRLKEVSSELKSLNKRFKEIGKKAKAAIKTAHKRADEKKVSELRKKMAL